MNYLDDIKYAAKKTPKDRVNIFSFLNFCSFNVPDYGRVTDLFYRHAGYGFDCVVYYDNICSQKMPLAEAIKKSPDNYASLYLGMSGVDWPSAKVTRMIQIGDRSYWFEFKSNTNWRSNKGKWRSDFIMVSPGYHKKILLPMFSIDFIKTDKTYAIDFDLIPGARQTTLMKVITRKEVSKLLKKARKHLEN